MKKLLLMNALSDDQRSALESGLAAVGGYQVEVVADADDWARRAAEASVLVIRDEVVSAEILEKAEDLELVIALTPANGSVDQAAADAKGIAVDSICNAGLLGVAEHTILLMLALIKRLPEVHRRTQQSLYSDAFTPTLTTQKEYAFNWSGIQGMDVLFRRTLGLVGLGTIARMVAQRARGFEMDVVYFDVNRLAPEEEEELGVRFAPLDQLLAEADFVSIHTRVTPETEKMVNADFLSKMKRTAYLINTARGRLVDEEALTAALQSNSIAGAGLDVFWMEPPVKDNPLLSLENVVLTSHCAGIFNDDAKVMEVEFIAKRVEGLTKK